MLRAGHGYEDLQLIVEIGDGGNYYCNQETKSPTSGWTGSNHYVEKYYGGTTVHTVSVATVCDDLVVASGEAAGTCETSHYCSAAIYGCRGSESCYATVSGVQSATAVDSASQCLESFATTAQAGEPCEFNVACESDACVAGICAAAKLDDDELGCDDAHYCLSGACGRLSVAADIDTVGCCATGASVREENGSPVCSGQPVNATCFDDALCDSNVCLFGNCAVGLLDDVDYCENDNQCSSGACALVVF